MKEPGNEFESAYPSVSRGACFNKVIYKQPLDKSVHTRGKDQLVLSKPHQECSSHEAFVTVPLNYAYNAGTGTFHLYLNNFLTEVYALKLKIQ